MIGTNSSMKHQQTLGSKDWLNQNEQALRNIFPETWTHVSNLDSLTLRIMYQLKLMDVHLHENELPAFMAFCEKTGIVLRNGLQIKRSNNHVEFETVFGKQRQVQRSTTKQSTSPVDELIKFILLMGWILGFVIAEGFWSTLFCFMPLWSWYLVIERIAKLTGFI